MWIRAGIIAAATLMTVLMFDYFEESKMEKGFEKFIKLDKYKLEHAKALDEGSASLAAAEKKLAAANLIYQQVIPLLDNYDQLGADSIASFAYHAGLLKEIEISKLKDEARNANNFLVMEALSADDNPAMKQEYAIAKEKTELYKAPVAAFLSGSISSDSAIASMNLIYPIDPKYKDKVKLKLEKFDIKEALKKDIEKSDNSIIVWGIVFTSILFLLIYIYVEKIKTPSAYSVDNMFKKLQLFSSAAFSIGHGGNDAQKVMGIIGAALIASGSIQDFGQLPNWVPVSCYLAIGIGTMSGGWKIVKTMGTKITKVTPLEGVAAETAGAFTLFFTGQMGIPVSTTHTITGSIIGVGATKRLSAVRWGVTSSLLVAWILTIPVSGILAGLVYYIITLFY
jgi:phosphate/sulfate permease